MSHLCILVRALAPEAGDATSPSGFAWAVARACAAAGDAVTLLHTDLFVAEDAAPFVDHAVRNGLRYERLRHTAPRFNAPIFPAGETHPAAHQVVAALEGLRPDACLVIDEPALAAVALAARETGCTLSTVAFALVALTTPFQLTRLTEGGFPGGGREEIVREFFERRAFYLADEIFTPSPNTLEALRQAGWIAGNRGQTLSPATGEEFERLRGALSRAAKSQVPDALPRVSVCMPHFEQPDFIEDALSSLAAQSAPPHEVLVLDDGSRSQRALAAFAAAEAKYKARGWKFMREANAGPAAARNRLAALATGDALLFCDADNQFRPEMIATLARAMAQTKADVVTCAFHAFRAEAGSGDTGYIFAPLGSCLELALVENVLGDTNFLVRREVFQALGGFPAANRVASEDWEFLLGLVRSGRRLEAVPAVLFDYRLASGSHSRSNREVASAGRALQAVLTAAEPAWQRLWPHIAGAIRNPHTPRLEHELRATRLEYQAKLEAANAQIGALREQARRHVWELVAQKSSAARSRALEMERRTALERRLVDTERERDHLSASLSQRDEKIRRMQDSFSWQATGWLRALRRMFVDRRKRAVEVRTKQRPATTRFSIDQPVRWDAAPARGVIRGWCLFDQASAPTEVRLLVNGAPVSGQSGLPRADVITALGLPAADPRCGFEFSYAVELETTHHVRIEIRSPEGEWHLLQEGQLTAKPQPRDGRDYQAWIEAFGSLTPDKATALRTALAGLSPTQRPLISVLMPVYNAPERWLARAIDSVREQVYENWELCIADDTSTAPHVRPLLERYQALDPRIRVVFRATNGHISAASNSALELVRGEFVALLDHDDELSPDALAEVALLLARHADTDLVYSDEDKIDEAGVRHSPYFKPDYLPDLLLGQNCLSHLSVYRTELVRAVGGFRVGYEGSQDWDLALRVVSASTPSRIRHLPKVLYHWRGISGSTAVAVSAKNYSVDAAKRALTDHLARRGLKAELQPVPGDHWQVRYLTPQPAPLVTIIIPTRNCADLLRTCVASIFARTEYRHFEILIVNNGSNSPDALALLRELQSEPNVRVLDYDAPFNFSAINNFAAKQARGAVLCFLNNDMEVITGRWLDELVSHAIRPEAGAVGAMLYYPDDTIQHAGVVLGLGGVANHAFLRHPRGSDGYMNRGRLAQNYSAVTGACLVIRRETFERVGGFNERDLAVAFNDIDLCLRVRALGLWNVWTPFAELYHHESASRGSDNTPEKQARFEREIAYMRTTWGPLLDADPAYNPNLAVNLLGWELAWPPRETKV